VDYLGEAPWPCRGAATGPIDTAGFPKDAWHYFRSIWNREVPTLHLFPHWNWNGHEGEFKQVVAYTNCDEVKLFLNGRLVGAKGYSCPNPGCVTAWNDFPAVNPTTHDLHLVWDVPYEPGELKAVGTRNGEAVAETSVKTTGEPVALRAAADKLTVPVGGLAQIEVSAADAEGLFVPDAAVLVRCEVYGPARLLGMDSGDLMDHTLYGSPARRMFSGLLLAAVETEGPGEIRVSFSADGMKDAAISINAQA
jgi:beta-galactosidase